MPFLKSLSTKLISTKKIVFNTSLLCCRLVVYDLWLQIRKDCVYCKGTIKDNGIFIGLCKPPLHFSCSNRSRKLFIAHDEQVQGKHNAKFGE